MLLHLLCSDREEPLQLQKTVLRIRDPEGKKSGMNIPDHFSESLETVFRVINTLLVLGTLADFTSSKFDLVCNLIRQKNIPSITSGSKSEVLF
jgi:hypothetical protein